MITINTEYFCEAARYYQKHGVYDDGIAGTYDYIQYWTRERDRCLNGYSVGGMRITGYHYWYLNYWPIWLTKEVKVEIYGEKITKDRKRGVRVLDFPRFWDVDYEFFHEFELAELNGQHFIILKPRGIGASYKGSSMVGRNFFLKAGSKNYLVAANSEFLLGDGLFTKFLGGRSFINKVHPHEDRYLTGFGKPSDYKKDQNDMHFRASSNIDGEERGFMSEVMGIAIGNDPQKHRGKRGLLMLIEEMGAFASAETVFNVARSSFEEGEMVFGTILGFGTGGTKATDFGAMEKMFYNPQSYNIRCFDNKWDDGMQGTKCAYFIPAYKNITYIDSKGNSDEVTAKAFYDKERVNAAKSPDANAIIQIKSEHPYSPQEAILRNTHSVLPTNEAIEWYNKLIATNLHKIGVPGELNNINGRIEFKPNLNLKPINTFPHNTKEDLEGCVVQYFEPRKINGKVPDNLYIIAHDPYAFDQSTDSESLGAAYVYMVPNNLGGFGDRIVATYFGRPKTTDDYNRNLFMLARYYNAKIGFENDRGDVIGYAKRFKLLDWLSDEFELAFDADLPKSKVRRQFGMHIGSGKENLRMHKGNKYLADWLITERGEDDKGTKRMNIHTIYCPSTLKEISLYRNDGGNFDRISALRILAYYMKELVYKESKPEVQQEVDRTSFFNRRHFN